MSRETRLNRTVRRALERRLKDMEAKKPPLRQKIGAIVLFVIGIPSILAAILALLPRLNVVVSEPVDPNNPFSSSVTVTNTGYVALCSVATALAVKEIDYGNLLHPVVLKSESESYDLVIQNPALKSVCLGLDDRFTYDLSAYMGHPPNLVRALVAVTVQYKILYIPLKRTKTFPLMATRRSDGKFYWYAQALPN